jgi:hypothetical protein
MVDRKPPPIVVWIIPAVRWSCRILPGGAKSEIYRAVDVVQLLGARACVSARL